METYNINQFLQLEKKVWSALASGENETDARLLADGFLGVYPSGFAVKADHVNQLNDGPTIAHYYISESKIQVLSEDIVLLSYLVNYARLEYGKTGKTESMYVTSIWQCFDGFWKNVFSQDTPIEGK